MRKKFTGAPEHVINYFFFIAEQVRTYMAKLGFRRMDEMIGRVDLVEMRPAVEHWKARGLDFSELLYSPEVPIRVGRRCTIEQDHGLEAALDAKLIEYAKPALDHGTTDRTPSPIPPRQYDRSISRSLEAICLKALAFYRNDRYVSVAELSADIGEFLAGRRVRAYPEGILEAALRLGMKYRTVLALLLAYVVMRILFLLFSSAP